MPVTTFDSKEKYRYLNGFNSHLEYEPRPSHVGHY